MSLVVIMPEPPKDSRTGEPIRRGDQINRIVNRLRELRTKGVGSDEEKHQIKQGCEKLEYILFHRKDFTEYESLCAVAAVAMHNPKEKKHADRFISYLKPEYFAEAHSPGYRLLAEAYAMGRRSTIDDFKFQQVSPLQKQVGEKIKDVLSTQSADNVNCFMGQLVTQSDIYKVKLQKDKVKSLQQTYNQAKFEKIEKKKEERRIQAEERKKKRKEQFQKKVLLFQKTMHSVINKAHCPQLIGPVNPVFQPEPITYRLARRDIQL